MRPTNDLSAAELVGRRVAFDNATDHGNCWHSRNGLRAGFVLRVGQTLAQKAELLEAEHLSLPNVLPDEENVVRLWVKADPCESFPRGCEVAVAKDCLLLVE